MSKGLVAALVFAIVAVLAASVLGVLLWRETSTTEYDIASARDEVSAVAGEAVAAYIEVDHRDPDAVRQRQRDLSTQELYDSNAEDWGKMRDEVRERRLTIDVTVLDVGVLSLDQRKGQADVVTAIERRARTEDGAAGTVRLRVAGTMRRVGDEWKLSVIDPVPAVGTGE